MAGVLSCSGSVVRRRSWLVGGVAGAIFVQLFTLTQNRWKIDDVLGVWPLHVIVWGRPPSRVGDGLEERRELAQREGAAESLGLGLIDVAEVGALHDQHQVGMGQGVGIDAGAGVAAEVQPSTLHRCHQYRCRWLRRPCLR